MRSQSGVSHLRVAHFTDPPVRPTHVHDGELGENLVQTLLEGGLGELDLAHVWRTESVVSIKSVRAPARFKDSQKDRIRLILKPDRMTVGVLRCVLERMTSRNWEELRSARRVYRN